VLELLKGGDLFSYLDRREFKIEISHSKAIVKGIAEAIQYIHKFGVVHRDIKLENILMTDSSEKAIPKITDFGLSVMIGPG
jgi:non-specific serine/threonine protein kinase